MMKIKSVAFFFLCLLSNITFSVCGDGILEATKEECDLGRDLNSDTNELSGCTTNCKIKTNWTCLKSDQDFFNHISNRSPVLIYSIDIPLNKDYSMLDLFGYLSATYYRDPSSQTTSSQALFNPKLCKNTLLTASPQPDSAKRYIQYCLNYLEALNKFKQLNYSVSLKKASITAVSNTSPLTCDSTTTFYQFDPITFAEKQPYSVNCGN